MRWQFGSAAASCCISGSPQRWPVKFSDWVDESISLKVEAYSFWTMCRSALSPNLFLPRMVAKVAGRIGGTRFVWQDCEVCSHVWALAFSFPRSSSESLDFTMLLTERSRAGQPRSV